MGKGTTDPFQYLEIRIAKCTTAFDPTRPCIGDTVINQIFALQNELYAGLMYVNPLINPGTVDYLDFYLEERNFISFGQTIGSHLTSYIEDYSIQTDQNLLPLEQNEIDSGIRIPPSEKVYPFAFSAN